MPYSNSKKKRNMKRVKSKREKKLKKRRSQKGGMSFWPFGEKTENVEGQSKSTGSWFPFFRSKKQVQTPQSEQGPPAPASQGPPAPVAAPKLPPSQEAALTIESVRSTIKNPSITQDEKVSLVAKIKGNAVLLKEIELDADLVARIKADTELSKMLNSNAQGSSGDVEQGSPLAQESPVAQGAAPAAAPQGGKGSKKKKKKRKRKQKGGTKKK